MVDYSVGHWSEINCQGSPVLSANDQVISGFRSAFRGDGVNRVRVTDPSASIKTSEPRLLLLRQLS